jgi:hypothetical protein
MIKKLTRAELVKRLMPSEEYVHSKNLGVIHNIESMLTFLHDSIGVVVFENLQMDSSGYGFRKFMAIGPGRTYQTVESCEGKWLDDLPSQRLYAVAWVPREEFFPRPIDEIRMEGEGMMPIEDGNKERDERQK